MDLSMAVWMEEYAIFDLVAAPVRAVNNMMVMPAGKIGNGLMTDWTDSILFLP